MPEQDAVLAITGGMDVLAMQQPLDLLWELVLPAMRDGALAEDVAAQQRLTARLGSLHVPTVLGRAGSPMAAQVSGRSYQVDPNPMQIETITLELAESGGTITAHTAAGAETIPYGYGTWQAGQTALFKQPFFDRTPIVASGAWTADDTLTLCVRLYETPFVYTLACHVGGAELLVELQINVSLESRTPLLLTAQLAR
jgi:hypothetical protein